jgi:hypothetical protein
VKDVSNAVKRCKMVFKQAHQLISRVSMRFARFSFFFDFIVEGILCETYLVGYQWVLVR